MFQSPSGDSLIWKTGIWKADIERLLEPKFGNLKKNLISATGCPTEKGNFTQGQKLKLLNFQGSGVFREPHRVYKPALIQEKIKSMRQSQNFSPITA